DAIEAVTADKLGTGTGEFLSGGCCQRDIGEPARPRPAADGDERFQMWVRLLEPLELPEVAAAFAAGIHKLRVGVGVSQRNFAIFGDVGESVVEMCQFAGGDIRHQIPAVVDRPGRVVTDDTHAWHGFGSSCMVGRCESSSRRTCLLQSIATDRARSEKGALAPAESSAGRFSRPVK